MITEKEEVDAFKNELKNLRFYRKKIKEFREKKETLEYEMQNVKGVDYSKQSGTYNQSAVEMRRLAMIGEMEWIEKQIKKWAEKEKAITEVLDQMQADDRKLVLDVVANKKRYKDVCAERGIIPSSLFNMIHYIIAEAQKKAG